MRNKALELNKEYGGLSAPELLKAAAKKFGDRITFASSFGAEDQVVIDMLSKLGVSINVFTLDTGRLPEQTYKLMEATRQRYGIELDILFPDRELVEKMVKDSGPNLFYDSIEKRKSCCQVRKVEPLRRFLANYDAWICGLRAEQSPGRTSLEPVEYDSSFDLIKVNPLFDWSTEQVWDYIKLHNVPYNKLHDEGYPSIGCACCTRAVKEGEDIRAGRWWWEKPEHKECGLHFKPKK